MKRQLIAEIERITNNRLTVSMREEIADRAIKIIEDFNRNAALVAIETVKKTVVEAAKDSATKEPNNTSSPKEN